MTGLPHTMGRMLPLRPYAPTDDLQEERPLTPAFDAAIRARWGRGPITEHVIFGRRSGAAIHALHGALANDASFVAFSRRLGAVLTTIGYDSGELARALQIAADAGAQDDAGAAIAFLIGQRTSSEAGTRPFAAALATAAVGTFGVPENGALQGTVIEGLGRRLAQQHGDALVAFLKAQHRLTAELLDKTPTVVLARSERRDGQAPARPATEDSRLRPLSSWATSIKAARGMARAEDAMRTGRPHVWIFLAEVPAARIISTWATGIGAQSECEVVLSGAAPGDRVAVMR
jgi:hypothetical protein